MPSAKERPLDSRLLVRLQRELAETKRLLSNEKRRSSVLKNLLVRERAQADQVQVTEATDE